MQTWGLTDPGNIRQQNQDSYAIVPFARDRVLMIVCDGMGGAKSGNVASSLAVEVFTGEVRRTQKAGMTPEKAAAMLRSALELANRAVYEQSQLSEDFTGMGTTLVAAFLSRDLAVIINVGDSRAYHFTREDVSLVTRDHSMVAYMVAARRADAGAGQAPPRQKRHHPRRRHRAGGRGRRLHLQAAEGGMHPPVLRRPVQRDGRSGDAFRGRPRHEQERLLPAAAAHRQKARRTGQRDRCARGSLTEVRR